MLLSQSLAKRAKPAKHSKLSKHAKRAGKHAHARTGYAAEATSADPCPDCDSCCGCGSGSDLEDASCDPGGAGGSGFSAFLGSVSLSSTAVQFVGVTGAVAQPSTTNSAVLAQTALFVPISTAIIGLSGNLVATTAVTSSSGTLTIRPYVLASGATAFVAVGTAISISPSSLSTANSIATFTGSQSVPLTANSSVVLGITWSGTTQNVTLAVNAAVRY